jgi:hypothetical protein
VNVELEVTFTKDHVPGSSFRKQLSRPAPSAPFPLLSSAGALAVSTACFALFASITLTVTLPDSFSPWYPTFPSPVTDDPSQSTATSPVTFSIAVDSDLGGTGDTPVRRAGKGHLPGREFLHADCGFSLNADRFIDRFERDRAVECPSEYYREIPEPEMEGTVLNRIDDTDTGFRLEPGQPHDIRRVCNYRFKFFPPPGKTDLPGEGIAFFSGENQRGRKPEAGPAAAKMGWIRGTGSFRVPASRSRPFLTETGPRAIFPKGYI